MGDIWNIKEQYKKEMGRLWSRGDRGVFAGGQDAPASYSNIIEYVSISSTGNATDFGDLTLARAQFSGIGSSTRSMFGGGRINDSGGATNIIDYITLASTGNAADFADRTITMGLGAGGSNDVRGLFAGGSPVTDTIDHISIASLSNAIDFGNLSAGRYYLSAGDNPIRIFWIGGQSPASPAAAKYKNIIEFSTINTLGNAVDYGDLSNAISSHSAASSNTRCVTSSGTKDNTGAYSPPQFFEAASTGSGTEFGDLDIQKDSNTGATSNSVRILVAGGAERESPSASHSDIIEYRAIAFPGNFVDFGDLTDGRRYGIGGTSQSHGGLAEGEPRGLPLGSGRGFFAGGDYTTRIQETHIPTLGNAADFGDLILGRRSSYNGASSYTRAVTMNSHVSPGGSASNTIEAFEMSSRGNASDFGDLSAARTEGSVLSSSTRGVTGGGEG